jgi:hypothetical protein
MTTFKPTGTDGRPAPPDGRKVTPSTPDAREGRPGSQLPYVLAVILGVAAFILAVIYYFFFAG